MSSTKDDGTASAAAEQLGSMSLGESAERKGEPETKNEDDTSGTPTKKLCSKCGKESDTLMKCRACKCVWYCSKDCQNRHWKEHKKECKPIKKILATRGGKLDIGNELDLGPLPDLPAQEECPICMRSLPLHRNLQTYYECCGKLICCGCDLQYHMKSGETRACAFCRTAMPESDEEMLVRLGKRVELKDPAALCYLALKYRDGGLGLMVDQTKCISLLRESAELGCPAAQSQLGVYHFTGRMGLEQNEEEAIKYWVKAVEGGYLASRYNLGCVEGRNGNWVAAMRHWRLSASGGYRKTIENLIGCFQKGILHHGDLAETLQSFYIARAELRSEDRDEYIAHLKTTGEYKAEYVQQ